MNIILGMQYFVITIHYRVQKHIQLQCIDLYIYRMNQTTLKPGLETLPSWKIQKPTDTLHHDQENPQMLTWATNTQVSF